MAGVPTWRQRGRVSLLVDGDWQVEWADDGVARFPVREGAGIQGMRERAQMANGRLDLRRRDGGGTVVELELPLSAVEA